MGALITNCTIKTTDSGSAGAGNTSNASAGAGNASSGACSPVGRKVTGCICAGNNNVSYQLCTEEGIYGDCVCAAVSNGGSSSGGASSSAGASNSSAGKGGAYAGGPSSASAGEGGEGGAAPTVDAVDCVTCLSNFCQQEWDDCVAEDENHPETAGNYCLSSKPDGSGQIESVLKCIDAERRKGLVKRDIVRACGSSLGLSADPSFFQWPPTDMTAVTAQLLNCMADAPTETTPGTWANSSNIPTNGSSPKPWLDNTCAKLSCTSAN
jgi:hypothetical protein